MREKEIENAMKQAATGSPDDATDDSFLSASVATDVRFENFNLPNKKGSGQDLLSQQNLTLAVGRRYVQESGGRARFNSCIAPPVLTRSTCPPPQIRTCRPQRLREDNSDGAGSEA